MPQRIGTDWQGTPPKMFFFSGSWTMMSFTVRFYRTWTYIKVSNSSIPYLNLWTGRNFINSSDFCFCPIFFSGFTGVLPDNTFANGEFPNDWKRWTRNGAAMSRPYTKLKDNELRKNNNIWSNSWGDGNWWVKFHLSKSWWIFFFEKRWLDISLKNCFLCGEVVWGE